jgi:hypothetical protein
MWQIRSIIRPQPTADRQPRKIAAEHEAGPRRIKVLKAMNIRKNPFASCAIAREYRLRRHNRA